MDGVVDNVADVYFNSCNGCVLNNFDFVRIVSNEEDVCLLTGAIKKSHALNV